ncbi:MAG TPA: phosphoribosyltransferase family protein [Chitinophagaceae bacterium]|mgnify:CR=1 FL=1|nr:phosphoribosyltransferase family protein [Chitinophagaceae bacterium]HPH30397.1 phosphoribosyltransferase family protein [Chitinophagaceae bacterium]HPN58271.1 phosphoribosyltransferase family protein [Chitinophagaceae bacterium]
MFRNRTDAGTRLAEKLKKFKKEPGIIMAVPRGGVPVAYAVAKELNLPVELVLTKKIGHPLNKEYAIGAASLTDYFIIPHEGVTDHYIESELQLIRSRLKEMQKTLQADTLPENYEGKTLLIIDDGIATGNTILGTIKLLHKNRPGKIVIAAPVASEPAVEMLAKEADEVIVLLIPSEFYGVGAFYEDFRQVSDEEVMYYLNKLKELRKAG